MANPVVVPGAATLSFWLRWDMETGFDGAVRGARPRNAQRARQREAGMDARAGAKHVPGR